LARSGVAAQIISNSAATNQASKPHPEDEEMKEEVGGEEELDDN